MLEEGDWTMRISDLCQRYAAKPTQARYDALDDAIRGTCRMKPGISIDICSRCGVLVNHNAASDLTSYIKPRYCPNCGRRIVE